jgi:hypothetical protein
MHSKIFLAYCASILCISVSAMDETSEKTVQGGEGTKKRAPQLLKQYDLGPYNEDHAICYIMERHIEKGLGFSKTSAYSANTIDIKDFLQALRKQEKQLTDLTNLKNRCFGAEEEEYKKFDEKIATHRGTIEYLKSILDERAKIRVHRNHLITENENLSGVEAASVYFANLFIKHGPLFPYATKLLKEIPPSSIEKKLKELPNNSKFSRLGVCNPGFYATNRILCREKKAEITRSLANIEIDIENINTQELSRYTSESIEEKEQKLHSLTTDLAELSERRKSCFDASEIVSKTFEGDIAEHKSTIDALKAKLARFKQRKKEILEKKEVLLYGIEAQLGFLTSWDRGLSFVKPALSQNAKKEAWDYLFENEVFFENATRDTLPTVDQKRFDKAEATWAKIKVDSHNKNRRTPPALPTTPKAPTTIPSITKEVPRQTSHRFGMLGALLRMFTSWW